MASLFPALGQPSLRFQRLFPAGSRRRAVHPVRRLNPGHIDVGGTIADPCD